MTAALSPEPTLRAQAQAWLQASDAPVPPLGHKAKHVRDPLHGSVVLAPHEVRLLDTWPMQRLRGVHQLGLVYLTFPSARHTRFEHALGVRFVAERMLNRLADVRGPYAPQQCATVLAAALLHDVGHGVFSHASEAIIAQHPTLNRQYDPLTGPLHEQIGALLIELDPIATCLRDAGIDPAVVAALLRHDEAELARHALPPELWGIISGPLDADKLDYFARDSYFSGAVTALDPERILRTLTFGPDANLAITLAGVGALDQMLFDRVNMYSDLYGHQKVLAAEAMARGIIELMLARGPRGKRGQLFVRGLDGRSTPITLTCVTDFLRVGDEAFLAAPTDLPAVARLQTRLQRRELLQRAYTLSFESARGASEAAYLRFRTWLQTAAGEAALRRELRVRLPQLGPGDYAIGIVRAPKMVGISTSVIGRDGCPIPAGSAFADWDALDDAGLPLHSAHRHFLLYRAKLYIFATPEHCALVARQARAALQALWREAPGELM